MAGADGDGQGVDLGLLHEVGGFFRVGQQLAVVQHAFRADAVFLAGHAGFQGTQAAQLAFHGHAAGMGERHGLLGHADVVVVVGRVLPSSRREPSIITELKPSWMERWQTSGLVP